MKRVIFNATILLIAFAVYACEKTADNNAGNPDPQEDSSANVSMQTMDDSYDSAFLASIKKPITKETGDFVNSDEAYGMLARYKDHKRNTNSNYNPKKDIYGFTFGIDKVEELVQNIRRYNQTHTEDTLVGIRVYFARKNANGKPIPDVFLIGVKSNGQNVYHVDNDFDSTANFTEEPVILNHSIPCPNNCD